MSGNNKSITIKASGSLRKHIAPGTTVDNVHTVGEAMSQLALPETGELIMLVNRRMAYWDTALEDGDEFDAESDFGTDTDYS